MKYNITITFEHGELSLEGCEKPFSTKQVKDESFKSLGLGKIKQITITFK